MKNVVIAYVTKVDYHQDDYEHTVGYARDGKSLAMRDTESWCRNLKAVVAESEKEALEALKTDLADLLRRSSMKPKDFKFYASVSTATNGRFWLNSGVVGGTAHSLT